MKNAVPTCIYMYRSMYVCTSTGVLHSQTHLCTYTQQVKIFNASVEWWQLPRFPTTESANSKVAQRVKECGKPANTALTLQRRSDLIRSGLATQPVSPVSSREISFPPPSRVYKAASPALAHSGQFHTHRALLPCSSTPQPMSACTGTHTSALTEPLLTGFDLPTAT